jgi:excisionase family DNA binding protein
VQKRQFISPAEVAADLEISSATVMRLIHRDELPAIRVSERIYRIPVASYEMFKRGTLRTAMPAPLRRVKRQPQLGQGEALPVAQRAPATSAR